MAITGISSHARYMSGPIKLDNQSRGFAELASKGITAFVITDGRRASQALLEGRSVAESGIPSALGGAISSADFSKVMGSLGATQAEADSLLKGLDSNGDGAITNDEILHGLAGTDSQPNTATAQLMLSLMDRTGNNDGVVQQREFMDVESSLVRALKNKSASGLA